MIDHGPTRHTIRARTLAAAFARVLAFLEGHAEVKHVTSGFGGSKPVTLQQIAEDLMELDESSLMAGLNGYAWTLDIALRSKPGHGLPQRSSGSLDLLAHVDRLSLTLHFQLDDSPDEVARLREALRTTMGIRLAPARLSQSRS
jgi:hypothetical protein